MKQPSRQPSLFTAGDGGTIGELASFHPIVAEWFMGRFPNGPTAPQLAAWPEIQTGDDVLVASPTGTGKTLTGFLVGIDGLWKSFDRGDYLPSTTKVVYVSPLKALTADVRENLLHPLEELTALAAAKGVFGPAISVGIRTGDSSQAERAALVKSPPDLLVTTPESLYLLLTSPKGRAALSNVETIIIDEIHTLARDKRGAHLAVTVERLTSLVARRGRRLQRIGLSATQRPLSVVGDLLSGVGDDRCPPRIIDCGHRKGLHVEVALPSMDLEAVGSSAQFTEMLDDIAARVAEHRTTLIFVNTRRMAERVAHQLAERLGDDPEDTDDTHLKVAAHHGSLSTARRRLVEARLRSGDLRALVATASLELGIDVGPVELVCQLGSPRAIATFMQRVGRANHHVGGTPAGRLYPLNRDELVECTALLAAVAAGDLDLLHPPVSPLDIAMQQVVAEVASAEECSLAELYDLLRHAAPFQTLSIDDFDEVLELAARGILTGRGRRGAHLHLDRVNGLVRPAKGARLTALLNGGAIPETGDYRVVLDPEGITIGQVNEDFAIDSAPGDVFLLGTQSWRVSKVETSVVRVVDAHGAKPSVPFWLGEAPARTAELSNWVGKLRSLGEELLREGRAEDLPAAIVAMSGVSEAAALQVATYLAASFAALGQLPTATHLVVERFFDDAEGSQLVVHSPHGGRINRALGLALRKRFCVTFDFELQAAADDNTVIISLGPHHSFPLTQVPHMVRSDQAISVLTQAVLPHPMLQARWRWNLNRALVVPRTTSGGRRPIHLQRMESEDLLAATWPSLAACQENAPPGPIPIPDHLLVRQTIADTLFEPMDGEGLVNLLRSLEDGSITVSFVESATPSPLAHGILTGQPYTFLDDAPLEERRARAVPLDRQLPELANVAAGGSVELDPAAVATMLEQLAPRVRTADELCDLVEDLIAIRIVETWRPYARDLMEQGRLLEIDGSWVVTSAGDRFRSIGDDDELAAECLRGHLERSGPIVLAALTRNEPFGPGLLNGAPLTDLRAATAIRRLESVGLAIELPDGRWCARHLLTRLYAASRSNRRRRIEAVPIATYVEALRQLQHVGPGSQLHGRQGVLAVVEQLQGLEIAAGDWERHILPARVVEYQPGWLDELCLSGLVTWVRLTPRQDDGSSRRGTAHPSASTPLALCVREDLPVLLEAVRRGEDPVPPTAGAAAELYDLLAVRGATFRADLPALVGRLASEVDQGLWELVARGLVHADAFSAVRTLLRGGRGGKTRMRRGPAGRLGTHRGAASTTSGEGRWSLVAQSTSIRTDVVATEELADQIAAQMLDRWGVVTFDHFGRESFAVAWRDVARALRRFEAQGVIAGGRFVAGIAGEQFARHEVADLLGRAGSAPAVEVTVSGSDPLNVTGYLLPGPRIPAQRNRSVTLRAGLVVEQPAEA